MTDKYFQIHAYFYGTIQPTKSLKECECRQTIITVGW